jgi:twitching motility protein PilT
VCAREVGLAGGTPVAATSSLDEKIYAVSDTKKVSMRELLSSFKRHGVARVTDLHLKTGKPPTYRVDGELKITSGRPLDTHTVHALARTLLGDVELATLKELRSVNSSHLIDEMRYRVNCFYDRQGMALAIRALDVRTPQIEWIGFPNSVWEDIVKLSQGLVLVTGTTGAGKSTTIAALIDRIIKTRPCHVITLEDPIEYQFESDIALISQRAVGRDVPSYERGLRDCLREDPDVIFVGEMTDQDSATWTLTAAETGHLVFSGIHTRDAAGTITRILDMYPPHRTDDVANQLSLALRYVLSQKLLQRADAPGRVVAMEILNNTYALSNLIRQLKPEQIFTLLQTHTRDVPEQRMTTFERSLARLVRDGKISRAEAERSANHPQILADELARQG